MTAEAGTCNRRTVEPPSFVVELRFFVQVVGVLQGNGATKYRPLMLNGCRYIKM
jgi:hypothetical protein